MPHTDSQPSTSSEGSPAVEQAEKQVLGNANYQKVEVVHRFADTHPWFHPLLAAGVVIVVVCVAVFLIRYRIFATDQ